MNIALLGFGTVGSHFYKLCEGRTDLHVAAVLSRRPRPELTCTVTADYDEIVRDPSIDIVVEVMGGIEPAYSYLCAAMRAGKHVVTANKQLMCAHFEELTSLAKEKGVALRCTAAAGGGIPWLTSLSRASELDEIKAVEGILNGTTNYMLSAMTNSGADYAPALRKAQELGCNKIALGHHFNDVIETTVMSMFYGSQMQAMLPKLHSTNFAGMELIRPLYCIHEEDILAWKQYNDLEFIQCACRFTENCTMCDNGGGGSKRQEVKTLLRRLKRDNPNIENSIFRSIHAVALDTMPGYKSEGSTRSSMITTNAERKANSVQPSVRCTDGFSLPERSKYSGSDTPCRYTVRLSSVAVI